MSLYLHPTNHSLHSLTSNKPYIPKPSNPSACARFPTRKRISKGHYHHSHCGHSSPITIDLNQLLQVKLELCEQLKHLSKVVLQQAIVFNEHVLSCTRMTNSISDIVATRPPLIQPLIPIENWETSISGPAKTTGNDTISPQSPHPSPVNLPTNASPPQTISTSFESPGHDSPPKSSIPSSLPRLHGFFNKSKTKSQPEKSAGRWLSHPQVCLFFWCFYVFITFITSFILSAIQVSSSAIVLCHRR